MRFVTTTAIILAVAPAAKADFAFTDLTRADLSVFDAKRWTARQEAARITLACGDCPGLSAIDIQIGDDDGTGDRVRSGQTTAATMTELGRANAARNPKVSEYFGAEAISRGGAVGFRHEARAMQQFTVTYILWDGGKRLIVRGLSPDRAVARRIAKEGYDAVAGQMAK